MQDTLNPNPTSTKFRRRPGVVGGVIAGLANTTGIDTTLLRVGTALATVVLGPVMVLAYLGAWLLMPVDKSVPESERPSSVPMAILAVVAAIVAFQIVVGLVTNLPFAWIVLGGIAAYWLLIRD
jgi:phage shock protein PspC (stress-responsive transcriptional regulator)